MKTHTNWEKINVVPEQGDLWLFDPDPIKGNEIGKKIRPALILSCKELNEGPSGLVIIVPITSKDKKIPSHLKLNKTLETGLSIVSFIICEQIRSISKDRLIKKIGIVSDKKILREVHSWVLDLIWPS